MGVETVARVQPDPVLPKDEKTYGIWLNYGEDADVHIYVMGSVGVVLGNNPTHKDLKFSNPALVLGKEGKHFLQYADADGNPKMVDVSDDLVKEAILNLLYFVKGKSVK